jgi:uncharacterized protein YbaR (Trm112 family)
MDAIPCPVCRAELSAVSSANVAENIVVPQPGDVTVCLHCAAALRFNATMLPQRLTAYDFSDFDPETLWDLTRLLTAVRIAKRTGRKQA